MGPLNPSGLCGCGCGQETPRSPVSRRGYTRGEHLRFIKGHSSRKHYPAYAEEDRGFETPCWIWQRYLNRDGYGKMWDGTRVNGAHRIYFEREFGEIPDGHDVHHRCGERACVNPAHLEALSRKAHMATEGRYAYGNPRAKVAA